MISIFSSTQKEFTDQVFEKLGKGRLHADLFYTHFIRTGTIPEVEPQARALMEQIPAMTDTGLPAQVGEKIDGKAVKFLLKFADGLESESVLIRMEAGLTLCLSSQVGCRMGCTFCETGRMGLLRHLTTAEIIAQVFYACTVLKQEVRNLVFMGMGEPFDNYDNVMQAVRVLTDPHSFGFGPRHITISTSGEKEAIERFAKEADPALNLAVSINAPSDELRNKIMVINKRWNLAALKEAMEIYLKHPRRTILIGYVMLKDLNDTPECAEQLAAYLRGLRVKINLIPYNPQSRDRFAPSHPETIDRFAHDLRREGYQVLLRHSKGKGAMAACGQLGNLLLRRQKMGNLVI